MQPERSSSWDGRRIVQARERIRSPVFLVLALLALPAMAAEFADGPGQAQRSVRLGGYLELRAIHYSLHPDGAAYQTGYAGLPVREALDRTTATLKLTGSARAGQWRLSGRVHADVDRDQLEHSAERRFDELHASWVPTSGFALDAGKIVQRWGRGHVWNPAAFVERPKDPTDPRQAREGYTMLSARLAQTFGESTAVTFNPVLLPVTSDVNEGFGTPGRLNAAARLLIEHGATDVSFQFLAGGSRSQRHGVTFAHEIEDGLEIYGEWARIHAQTFRTATPDGVARSRTEAVTTSLAGIQYRPRRGLGVLLELYRNGTGFRPAEMRDYADLAASAALAGPDSPLMARATRLAEGGFGRSQPMRNYLYVRVTGSTAVAGPALSPSVRITVNLDDRSWSLTPELQHAPPGAWGWRLRLNVLGGRPGTEYGEKRYRRRVELRLHHHF